MLIYSCYYLKSTYFRVAKYDCDTLVAVYGPCIGKGNKNKRKTSSNIFNSSVFCIGLFLLSRLQMVCFILPHTTDIKNFFFSYFLSKKKTVVFISYRLALGCVSIRSKRKKKEIKVRLPKWYTFFLNKENVENSTFFFDTSKNVVINYW